MGDPGRPNDADALRSALRRIDGRGYKAYKALAGEWVLPGVMLCIDHVQGDPFAAPSRMRLRVDGDAAGWPRDLYGTRVRRIAFEDFLARRAQAAIHRTVRGRRGSGKSGDVFIDAGRQAILERTAANACEAFVEVRVEVGLPAAGRRVLAREAETLLVDELPALAAAALVAETDAIASARHHVETAQNHAALVDQLAPRGLVAFVPDGARLPRQSGASQRPLSGDVVPFRAPDALRVALEVPNPVDGASRLSGMGIPRGITLIVGGGYHGKSTLLQALERAVFPHVPGDGRERVATLADAVKVRAEDGRRVVGCDIHAFIGELPGGRSTTGFTSDDASGSTSQAASIVEALEAGSNLLLLDEDTSATNFMIRDARMQALVAPDHEPITPFIDRARELHETLGVSTVLVMGGSGDYFDIADTVIEMRAYAPHDATEAARRIASEHPTRRRREVRAPLVPAPPRVPRKGSLDPSRGRRDVKIAVRDTDLLGFGRETIDLRAVEPLIEPSQTRAIGYALVAARRFMDEGRTFPEILDALDAWIDDHGVGALDPAANLARPRRYEIAAALSRLRSLDVVEPDREAGA